MAPHQKSNDAADIKAQLVQRLESLLGTLLVDGKRAGGWYGARSPVRADGKFGTFWVSLYKHPGNWHDFSQQQKGDVFQLIAVCRGLRTFPEVLDWSRDWLGIRKLTPQQQREQAEKARRIVQQREKDRDARDVDEAKRKRGQAQAAWIKARPVILDTPVDTYFKTRGIDLRRLARLPSVIRYDPDAWYEEGVLYPAMRTMMTAADGSFAALHTTFLADGGHGKASVDSPKKIRCTPTGAAMRLARGASGLDVATAGERGVREPLVLAEGIENALTVALVMPELRVWAVGTVGNFASQMPPACCNELIICADNDIDNKHAQAALQKAIASLAQHGRPISIMRSPVGKDVNDALRLRA